MRTFIFSTAFVWNISHFKNTSARCYHNCRNAFLEIANFSCHVLITLGFSRQIYEKKQVKISNFMKIRPMGAELFVADGRADMTKLIVAFHNFTKAPTNTEKSQK